MTKIDYYKLLASVCRESYFEFFCTFWPYISTEPLKLNWHIKYLCDEVQYHMERVFQGLPKEADLVVNISPGTSKSSIFSVMLVPWAWTRMPGMRYIGTSFVEDLAFELTVKSRRVVQSPLYQRLFPEISLRNDINSKSLWSNTLGGDRYAVGMGGGIMGRHAHVIGIDDPLDPKGGRSEAEITKAEQYCCETLPSRKVDKERTWTFLVMQRISMQDPTALFLEKFPNVKHICLPGELSDDVRPLEARDFYKEGLFDPQRLSRKVLDAFRAELGEYGYAGQILQRPIPVGGGMIKPDRIVRHRQSPGLDWFQRVVRFWDRAAQTGARSDWTVGVKMGLAQDGTYWILDIVRGQWETAAREDIILQTAHKDGKTVRIGIEREPGSAGIDSARETTKRLSGFVVYAEPATGTKELRADTFSVQINAGNVHTCLRGAVWDAYYEELQHFPDGKHDDQVDATAGAFSMLINPKVRLGSFR